MHTYHRLCAPYTYALRAGICTDAQGIAGQAMNIHTPCYTCPGARQAMSAHIIIPRRVAGVRNTKDRFLYGTKIVSLLNKPNKHFVYYE